MIGPRLWSALIVLIIADTIWLAVSGAALAPGGLAELAHVAVRLALCGWACVRFRHHRRFALLWEGAAFMLIAWPALRVLNHLSMTTALPLADPLLAAMDQALGFDWLGYLLWADQQPTLLQAMRLFYTGLSVYSAFFFFVILATSRDPRTRCGEFIALFFITAVACCLLGQFFPALSAAIHHAPSLRLFDYIDPRDGAYHLEHLERLRSDPMPVLSLSDLPGLVTFPSFHTAMGVIAIYCCRSIPLLSTASWGVNIIMVASTPVFGAHYFVDIVAGVFVAAIVIGLYRRFHCSPGLQEFVDG